MKAALVGNICCSWLNEEPFTLSWMSNIGGFPGVQAGAAGGTGEGVERTVGCWGGATGPVCPDLSSQGLLSLLEGRNFHFPSSNAGDMANLSFKLLKISDVI